MPNYNKVILIGHLTRDPELRYTPKGSAVSKISIAINHNWKTESGEKKEEVSFIDITAFGKQAENVSQYFKKGKPIMVEGRLKLDQWEDKATHEKRQKLGVVMESFNFIESKPDTQGASEPRKPAHAAQPATDRDDDVPF